MESDVLFAKIPKDLKEFVDSEADSWGITKAAFVTAVLDYVRGRSLVNQIIEYYDEVVLDGNNND